MDSLENNYSSKEETRQLQKMQLYQKLVLFTLLKFKWSIIAVFAVTIIVGVIARYVQFHKSPGKYEGSITLFYTPRASEEVKTLSINHVLGIFSRQQVFQQLIEEMQLSEKQRAVLKQCIEVKLLKDQHDMFVITGQGESDEYVKQLVNTFVAIGIRNYKEYRASELRNYLNAREQRLYELQAFQKNMIEELHGLHRKYGIVHPKEEMDTVKKIQGEQSAATAELNVKLADARQRFAMAEKKYKSVPENVVIHRAALLEFVRELRKAHREYEKAKLIFSERNPRYVEASSNYQTIFNEFENFKKRNNITRFDQNMLLGLDGLVDAYHASEVTLHQLEMSMKSLQAEIKLIKDKEKKLQHMIPEHDRIGLLQDTTNKKYIAAGGRVIPGTQCHCSCTQ